MPDSFSVGLCDVTREDFIDPREMEGGYSAAGLSGFGDIFECVAGELVATFVAFSLFDDSFA